MMKKIISIFTVLVMCLSICACSNQKSAQSEQMAKEAYDLLVEAYTKTDEIGGAIYGVWAKNVGSSAKIKKDPLGTLLPETKLSKDELKSGILFATGEVADPSKTKDDMIAMFRNATEEEKSAIEELEDEKLGAVFAIASDMPQFCVLCVQDAYYINGGIEFAQSSLESAKLIIKEVENSNANPKGMEAIKNIYVATSSYLDFCLNTKGSLVQASDTINGYRTTVKTAMSELELIY